MIQGFACSKSFQAPRRTAAVLLAVLLNLALLPCSMALEVVEEGHDCCPPELRLDPSECCEVDTAAVDVRDGFADAGGDDVEHLVASMPDQPDVRSPRRYLATAGPPGAPPGAVALHKLNCVYLD